MIVLLVALAFCKELVVTVMWARAVAPGPYGPGVVAAPHKGGAPTLHSAHSPWTPFWPKPKRLLWFGGALPPYPALLDGGVGVRPLLDNLPYAWEGSWCRWRVRPRG